LEPFGEIHTNDAEVLDHQGRFRRDLRELLTDAQRRELLGLAADEDEPVEVPAVRLEEDGLEVLDRALLLETAVLRERLVEDLDRLRLATSNHLAPADEETCICHSPPPAS
jgi:hypothetical protein